MRGEERRGEEVLTNIQVANLEFEVSSKLAAQV